MREIFQFWEDLIKIFNKSLGLKHTKGPRPTHVPLESVAIKPLQVLKHIGILTWDLPMMGRSWIVTQLESYHGYPRGGFWGFLRPMNPSHRDSFHAIIFWAQIFHRLVKCSVSDHVWHFERCYSTSVSSFTSTGAFFQCISKIKRHIFVSVRPAPQVELDSFTLLRMK